MNINKRIKDSLILIIGRDRTEEFANIVTLLSKNYSMTGCCYSINGNSLEQKVFSWETEKELADLIRSMSKDHRIVYIVHHKHKSLIISTEAGVST